MRDAGALPEHLRRDPGVELGVLMEYWDWKGSECTVWKLKQGTLVGTP